MNALLDCVVCQQRQALRIARLVTQDPSLHEQIMREAMSYLAQRNWDTAMTITIGLYAIIERLTGNSDPYKTLKVQSNQKHSPVIRRFRRIFVTALTRCLQRAN